MIIDTDYGNCFAISFNEGGPSFHAYANVNEKKKQ